MYELSLEMSTTSIRREAIGLYLKNEKCDVISRSDTSNLTQAGMFNKFVALRQDDSILLDAPLSKGSVLAPA